jgi:hypothetical protein
MAILKATISFQTTTLFPNPVNFTVPVNETVDLDAAFSTVVIAAAGSESIYSTAGAVGVDEVTYIYIQSAANNDAGDVVTVDITDSAANTATVGKLLPGDFLYIPVLADGSGVDVTINNTAGASDATFYYIFAERG